VDSTSLLANVRYAIARLSVRRLAVRLVRPTQAVKIFGNISTELNTRGVAKYSDLGPIDGYISETVQDRR